MIFFPRYSKHHFPCVLALIAAGALVESACLKTRAAGPAPDLPVPTVTTTSERPVQPSPAPAPAPPQPSSPPATSSPAVEPPAPEPAPATPSAAQQPPQTAPPRPARTVAPNPTPAAPPATAAPVAPAPQLAAVLTAEQQRQLNADVDQSIEHAQTSLRSVGNRQLTQQQQADMDQIHNFMRQAQSARTGDLPAAKSLAERAEVMARNLEKSLR